MQTPTRIEAGQLRHRINIIDPTQITTQQDGFGGEIPASAPTPFAVDVHAKIEFVAAKLQYTASTFTSQVTHNITIRWRPGIRAQQEVTYVDDEGRTRILQIQFIDNPKELKHFLVLSCLERDQSTRLVVS
jgi:SPP1 family predicted phage head-tail adaptor